MPPSVSPCVGRDHAYLANAIAICAPPADFLVAAIRGRRAELPRSDRTGSTARGLDGAVGGQPFAADPRRTTVGAGTRQRVAGARGGGRASPTLVRGAADLRQRIAWRGSAARDLVGPSVPRRHSAAGGSHPTGGAARRPAGAGRRRPARRAGAAAPRRAAARVLAGGLVFDVLGTSNFDRCEAPDEVPPDPPLELLASAEASVLTVVAVEPPHATPAKRANAIET